MADGLPPQGRHRRAGAGARLAAVAAGFRVGVGALAPGVSFFRRVRASFREVPVGAGLRTTRRLQAAAPRTSTGGGPGVRAAGRGGGLYGVSTVGDFGGCPLGGVFFGFPGGRV